MPDITILAVPLGSVLPYPCPECGGRMVLRWSQKFGPFYGCSNWPRCNCCHGAHPTGKPKGTPGDAKTRLARVEAHAAFDSLWRDAPKRHKARRHAYAWLCQATGIPDAHIGSMTIEQCELVVQAVKRHMDSQNKRERKQWK